MLVGVMACAGAAIGGCASDEVNKPSHNPCGGESQRSLRQLATESGTVVGVVSGETDAFLGLPFAAAPVGERRWGVPEAFGCFDAPFDANALGPRCTQLDADETTVVGEEDCLQLNVWTPTARGNDASLPVLFFIHGGGNAVGSAVDPLYDGADLAAEGVVVVTANYRLGALGFLLQDGVPTNLAVRDQLAALSWVSRNISAFGGDPNNVTVFGESAGAVNTCTLLGVPAAQGLLHRAIVQSGACIQRSATTYREQMGGFVDSVGCSGSADVVACLRALDPATIVRAEPTGFPNIAGLSVAWGPHVDGDLLPASTLDQMERGESQRVPWIIGSNSDETAASVMPGMTRMQFENLVRISFLGRGMQILAQYPASDFPDGTEAWIRLTTEAKFQCNARRAAQLGAAGGLDTRLYMFAYDDYTSRVRQARAIHGIELPFLFGTFSAIELAAGFVYTPNADDLAMRDEIRSRWLGFARGDDLATQGTPSWSNYPDAFLVVDSPSIVGTTEYPNARCDFWDGLTASL